MLRNDHIDTLGAVLRNSGSSLKDQRDGCVCVCVRVWKMEKGKRMQGRGSGNREGGGKLGEEGGSGGWKDGGERC